MSVNSKTIRCSPHDIFAVVGDGWLFPVWVVGASRMRDVDASWPHVGSHVQHSFGVWPVLINDETTSLQWNPPHRLVLQPKGWPLGEARVTLEVKPHAKGCRVTIIESAVRGPGTLVPKLALDVVLFIRNIETLRRLAYLAEGHAGGEFDQALEPVGDDRTPPKRAGSGWAKRLVLASIAAGLVVALVRKSAK